MISTSFHSGFIHIKRYMKTVGWKQAYREALTLLVVDLCQCVCGFTIYHGDTYWWHSIKYQSLSLAELPLFYHWGPWTQHSALALIDIVLLCHKEAAFYWPNRGRAATAGPENQTPCLSKSRYGGNANTNKNALHAVCKAFVSVLLTLASLRGWVVMLRNRERVFCLTDKRKTCCLKICIHYVLPQGLCLPLNVAMVLF